VWFRFFFVLSTSVVAIIFVYSLRMFPLIDWSFEQKWVSFCNAVKMQNGCHSSVIFS
jgi:hypothetical protein